MDTPTKTKLSTEFIRRMLQGNFPYANRSKCMDVCKQLKRHINGDLEEVIIKRRPSEPKEVKEYRTKIYVPITKTPLSKVVASLEKIRRASDWSVQYNIDKVSSKIAKDETLQKYCEEKYPEYTSVTNWAFSELLRLSLIDPNGIVAVIPKTIAQKETEYNQPVAEFFESDQIVEYQAGEYLVLKSRDTLTYTTHNGARKKDGSIFYVLTPTQFIKYEQRTGSEAVPTVELDHNIGEIPAFKAGGIRKGRANNETIYESYLAGMVPFLDEAAREYSDLQAEIVQHMYSERYAFATTECPDCVGSGTIMKEGKEVKCPRCNGTGSILNRSPYGLYLIDNAKAGESQAPTPPIGYIQKNTDIARLQDERVEKHIRNALSAVHMEFLSYVPTAQSGTAKEFDRDEFNNFVNTIAENMVRILDRVYYFIGEYRYSIIVPNKEERKAMLPSINVPTKFNILNTSVLMAELSTAKQSNVNPVILREMEIDYAKKLFNTSPEIAEQVETTFDLNPLFGIKEEDKMTMLSNGGITEIDYIISCNIQTFVRRAMVEDENFATNDYAAKMEIMKKYAQEIKKANTPSTDVLGLADINPNPQNTEEQEEEEDDPANPNPKQGKKKNPPTPAK